MKQRVGEVCVRLQPIVIPKRDGSLVSLRETGGVAIDQEVEETVRFPLRVRIILQLREFVSLQQWKNTLRSEEFLTSVFVGLLLGTLIAFARVAVMR